MRKALIYARFETMRSVLLLIAGNLDFSAFNLHAAGTAVPTADSKELEFFNSQYWQYLRGAAARDNLSTREALVELHLELHPLVRINDAHAV